MTIKAVLLDLDDTLWPVAPVIQHAEATLQQWMQEHVPAVAQAYSVENLRERRNALLKTDARFQYDLWALRHTLLSQVFQEHGVASDKADQAMQVFAAARNKVNLYIDVKPSLSALQEKLPLGTVSNGFADLHAIGIAHHFRVSIAAFRFGCAKPDPRIFLAACQELGLEPQQVLYVGDDLLLDVQGAQLAGLQAGWMNRQGLKIEDQRHLHIKPDAEFANLHDLLLWV
ncbi:HAD family hydrolase [Undibacterium sp. TS12]|uniref:HAD family hydrolase n=1 Tax=Undibacterium sp. TS12 TaxID=2908202 RepID=UPI001F4D0C61|nr:HAD family hydrolase [Undibacterium sp. TS12]MCH8620129.1 HAD family hydrolase [Undibacterium sp. TS12]